MSIIQRDKLERLPPRARAEVEASTARLMNEYLNMLSPEALVSVFRQELFDKIQWATQSLLSSSGHTDEA